MNRLMLFLVVAVGLMAPVQVNAQGENYTLRVEDAAGGVGSTVDVPVLLDSASGGDLVGLSFGLCHPADIATIGPSLGDIADGSAITVLNDGDGPDFNGKQIVAGGWTVGMIVVLVGSGSLPSGDDQELYVASYSITAVGSGDLSFCEIGSPVVNIFVNEGGGDLVPSTSNAILSGRVDPIFTFAIADEDVGYDAAVGDASFRADVSISQNANFDPIDTSGFSMGIGFDSSVLSLDNVDMPGGAVELVPDVVSSGVLAAVNDGDGPDFFGVNDPTGGVTIGAVYVLVGSGGTIAFSSGGDQVLSVGFSSVGGVLTGDLDGASTTLTFEEDLGDPVVPNVIVAQGGGISYSVASGEVSADDGTISFVPTPPVPPFATGDCNDDGDQDIGDAIFILNHLFHPPGQPSPAPGCPAACNVNGGDKLDSSDAIFILNWQFLDGPAPVGSLFCVQYEESDLGALSCEEQSSCD